jgi:hypothetical protein
MAERQRSAVDAAGAALGALERYSLCVARLVARRVDTELYQRVARDIDEVRHACRELPAAASAWTSLLIAHAELMHGLWQSSRGPAPDLPERLARVQGKVQALQAVCMRVAAPPPH